MQCRQKKATVCLILYYLGFYWLGSIILMCQKCSTLTVDCVVDVYI